MRLNLRFVTFARCLILLATGVIPLEAGIRPSFSLDQCSWGATHIVLVEMTAKDGGFLVVRSWKGDLKTGDFLEVPELKPDENAMPISRYPKLPGFDHQDKLAISEQIPRQPVGSRMILFLKRREERSNASPSSNLGTRKKWEPASSWGGMRVSALWIDGGEVFCFQQWMNPGPSALSKCSSWSATSSDEAVFTERIQKVLQTQRNLADTLALKNVDVRVERLGRIALGNVHEAQKEAIKALGRSHENQSPE